MALNTEAQDLRDGLGVMLTGMGFEPASGDTDAHRQTWTRVSTDMTVHRQGDDVFVETSARRAYPVATVEHVDLENVLTRALLHAHDDDCDDCESSGTNCRAHRTAEQRTAAGW
jgi:hypothetical protein